VSKLDSRLSFSGPFLAVAECYLSLLGWVTLSLNFMNKGHFILGVRTMKVWVQTTPCCTHYWTSKGILLRCTLVPRGKSGFINCMEYFDGLGPRRFGAKIVPYVGRCYLLTNGQVSDQGIQKVCLHFKISLCKCVK
jgi:hypothetical protein